MRRKYRYDATSAEGFMRQLVANYVSRGFLFYVAGTVKEHQDPESVHKTVMEKYGVGISSGQRAYRKSKGKANVHFLAFEDRWVLLCSYGKHKFFEEHYHKDRKQRQFKDIRYTPLYFRGYSVTVKKDREGKNRVRVAISRKKYRELKAELLEVCCRRSVCYLERRFRLMPFEPYAEVLRQVAELLYRVNKKRATRGLSPIAKDCLRTKLRMVSPFAGRGAVEQAA